MFFDDVQYTKNDWRNRNRIKGPNGPQWLTIPVGSDENRLINEVLLPTDARWATKHWKTIESHYRNAPHFGEYKGFLRDLYTSPRFTSLSELNQFLIRTIAKDFLGITTEFVDSSAFGLTTHKQERVVDLLKAVGATTYISGPAAKDYLNAERLASEGIDLVWKDYAGYPEYDQVHPPFEHSVSIVDLLLHTGTRAPEYIWGWRARCRAMTLISVVIPVYRSANTLPQLHQRLGAALEKITPDFEIIFVEDCGGDASWTVIQDLAAGDTRVRGLKLSRNFGQHAATICGLTRATGTWVATLDDDLEHQPEFLPELYAAALQGHALVYGVYEQRSHKPWRNLTSRVGRALFTFAIPSLNYEYTSFRLIHRDVASVLGQFDSPFPFVDGYLSWVTNNYAAVKVPHAERASGASNYNLRKLIIHTVNIFVTFSDLPLRLASWIGLATFLIGMIWLAAIVGLRMLGGITVSGYASVMSGIIFFGGIQLLILGVFGAYLGRMNFKSSRKPLFLVSQDTAGPDHHHVALAAGGKV